MRSYRSKRQNRKSNKKNRVRGGDSEGDERCGKDATVKKGFLSGEWCAPKINKDGSDNEKSETKGFSIMPEIPNPFSSEKKNETTPLVNGEEQPAENGEIQPPVENGEIQPPVENGEIQPPVENGEIQPLVENGEIKPPENGAPAPVVEEVKPNIGGKKRKTKKQSKRKSAKKGGSKKKRTKKSRKNSRKNRSKK
jgi:hypothetical protein